MDGNESLSKLAKECDADYEINRIRSTVSKSEKIIKREVYQYLEVVTIFEEDDDDVLDRMKKR